MGKPLRYLLITVFLCALLGVSAWLLLTELSASQSQGETTAYLVHKQISEISMVSVSNENGEYSVKNEDGLFTVHDIPGDVVNTEYVDMLLDECSSVYYESVANEQPEDLQIYGLQKPTATVNISYTDGTELQLLFGDEEPVSGGRYFKTAADNRIMLMKKNRTIRFTMAVEKYINYIIIEPNTSSSILSAVQDITFSGTQLEQPIVLKAVLEDRAEIKRTASSFGAVTHLITSPVVHEANQTELIRLTESLLGLISEGVVDYNCTEQQIADYGFDDPVLQVAFDYKNGTEAEIKHYVLKLSKLDGSYIAKLEGQNIIYRIANVAFTQVNYESLVLRWFLSPFLSDVKTMEVDFDNSTYTFDMAGDTAKELRVLLADKELDSELYRKYYNLVLTAASEGEVLRAPTLPDSPEMTVRFVYKDAEKPDDIMRIYRGDVRRVYVEVNGVCEFFMREKYLSCIKNATISVANGQNFAIEW